VETPPNVGKPFAASTTFSLTPFGY
jgi:hypothetical protein